MSEKERSGRLGGFLRLAFALAVLAFVGFNLPWQDSLIWKRGGGQDDVAITGSIEGDWKATAFAGLGRRFRLMILPLI